MTIVLHLVESDKSTWVASVGRTFPCRRDELPEREILKQIHLRCRAQGSMERLSPERRETDPDR